MKVGGVKEIIEAMEERRNSSFTGTLTINFHKGSISDKASEKRVFRLKHN